MMNYRFVNTVFTGVCLAFPPILGSLVSFVWHGGALWCLFEVVSGRRPLSRDGTMRAMAALFAIYVLWNLLAFAVNFTTLHDARHLVPLVTYLLFPFSYSVWSISRKDDIAQAGLAACALACFGALALALYQFFALRIRAEGGAGNALVFAQVVAMAGSICLVGAIQIARWRLLLLAAFGAAVAAVVMSGSRTDWLIVFLDTVLVAILFHSRLRAIASVKVVLLALVVAAAVIVAFWPFVWVRVEELFRSWHEVNVKGEYDSSLGVRLALWQIGTDLFVQHPFLGYGMHRTTELMAQNGIEAGYSHFHNGFLTLLVQSGVVGALSIAAIFAIAAVTGVRVIANSSDRVEKLGAVILLLTVVTYMVAGMSNKLLGHDILDTMLMVYLIVGLYLAVGTSLAPEGAEPQRDEHHSEPVGHETG
jgi:O-antigen ligase